VPPLRERTADILPLAEHFAARAFDQLSSPRRPIASDAAAALERYAWPGNIRELKNAIDRAVFTSRGEAEIHAEHLPPGIGRACETSERATQPPPPAKDGLFGEMAAFERQRIVDALEQCSGNQTRAARLLGISRRTLVSRIAAHGLPRPRK
jgi:two-component system, NtrC family, response regulator AtoC